MTFFICCQSLYYVTHFLTANFLITPISRIYSQILYLCIIFWPKFRQLQNGLLPGVFTTRYSSFRWFILFRLGNISYLPPYVHARRDRVNITPKTSLLLQCLLSFQCSENCESKSLSLGADVKVSRPMWHWASAPRRKAGIEGLFCLEKLRF